jgi:hypothetical protein
MLTMEDGLGMECRVVALFIAATLAAVPLCAQVTPAARDTPPDDTPSIRVGATLFGDYTVTERPKGTDAEGNEITPNAFDIGRAYINVTGNISHLIGFRITPDIVRETGTGSSLAGSYTFRLKYAYAQFNLDDWLTRGSWARLGMQQTPWIEFEETVYRYRFQGNVFADREDYLSSSDTGASFRYVLPGDYGDVHAGVYNGETFEQPGRTIRRRSWCGARSAPCAGTRCSAGCGSPASTTRTPMCGTGSAGAASAPSPSSTPTPMRPSATWRRPIERAPAPPRWRGAAGRPGSRRKRPTTWDGKRCSVSITWSRTRP